MVLVLAPDGRTGEAVTGGPRRKGEKGALVLAGSLEITIGPDVIVLEEGDAVQFNAETPHAFRNAGAHETQVLWVISQVPAERHI
jgi:quercetin dioxygenase-like cupin family protein